LTGHVDLLAGLRRGGWVLVNSTVPTALNPDDATVLTVPATRLALQYIGKPVPNAALLGGFAALTGRLRLESVLSAIRERFPARLAEGNVAAAEMAYRIVRAQREEFVDA
jgi:pyruvate ferredoxin oxidoreductase gamma subunit